MKVSDIIRQLSKYPPDEELVIAWWDRNCFSRWDANKKELREATPEEWAVVIRWEKENGLPEYSAEVVHDFFSNLLDDAELSVEKEVTA